MVAAVAASIGLVVAGCSDQNDKPDPGAGGPAPAPADAPSNGGVAAPTGDPAIDWANSVCGPIDKLKKNIETKTPKVESADPKATMTALAEFLDQIGGGLDTALVELGKVGPSPIPDGDKVKDTVIATFGPMRDSFKATAGKLREGDAEAAQQAIEDFSTKMEGLADPFKDAPRSPKLEQVMETAANCQSLSKI
jgi:hypothetical protein